MKQTMSLLTAASVLLILPLAVANPVPEAYLSELWFTNGSWVLEMHDHTTESLDGWTISSRSGRAQFRTGMFLKGGYNVITPDSLQTPLTINPAGDSVSLLNKSGTLGMRLIFGEGPTCNVKAPAAGWSICFSKFYYLDTSPTIGSPNDSAGAMVTISGLVIDSASRAPVSHALIWDGNDELGSNCYSSDSGTFSGRFYAHNLHLYAELFSNTNYWAPGVTLSLVPGQTVDSVVFAMRPRTSVGEEGKAKSIELFQNFPNPFNPSTTISYRLPVACNVTLTVYDGLGREIIELVRGFRAPGAYRATWNGRDQFGGAVGSGIYLARLVATERGKGPSVSKTLKLLLLH